MGLPSKHTKNYCKQCQPNRAKSSTIFIVCEGHGEKVYFNRFNRRNRRIQIKVSADKRADLIVKYAMHLVDSKQIDLDVQDQLWCIFDRDDTEDEYIAEAQRLADERSFKTVYSNPCFEIWYFWHFLKSRQAWPSSQAIKQKMCNIIPNYRETGDYYDLLLSRQSKACEQAEQARKCHIQNGILIYSRDSNPVTDIDILVHMLNK